MAEIKAFGALRFTNKAGAIDTLVCPPYDIISEQERKQYLEENPHNIIRLELPREGEHPYQMAGDTLNQWLEQDILACDAQPAFYIYEERFTAHGQSNAVKGFVCRVKIEEFDKNVVLPHEETLSKAKTDRFHLMSATDCNFSSIYSLYFDTQKEIFPLLEQASAGAPDQRFHSKDGVEHLVWRLTDSSIIDTIQKAFSDKKLYIADGHHRYETALNYRNHLREQGVVTNASHPANYVMMTLVHMEHPGLVVFPTHRIVRRLENFNAQALLEGCARYFDESDCATDLMEEKLTALYKQGKKAFVFYHKGKATLLTLRDASIMQELLPNMSQAYRQLDVSILHTVVLERLLGIDKENMANQINLTYTRDAAEAIAEVDAGTANAAFLINPTRVDEIAAVAGAGEKMPQKSTYFYPKLITGHVMNRLK